ncbi:hypothetical protein I204_06800 [Kwoniella mangroviensis CBS 8886]|nr:hypothetical protein I204_06800 [Kwoniella mangroviensis CBS 8886]
MVNLRGTSIFPSPSSSSISSTARSISSGSQADLSLPSSSVSSWYDRCRFSSSAASALKQFRTKLARGIAPSGSYQPSYSNSNYNSHSSTGPSLHVHGDIYIYPSRDSESSSDSSDPPSEANASSTSSDAPYHIDNRSALTPYSRQTPYFTPNKPRSILNAYNGGRQTELWGSKSSSYRYAPQSSFGASSALTSTNNNYSSWTGDDSLNGVQPKVNLNSYGTLFGRAAQSKSQTSTTSSSNGFVPKKGGYGFDWGPRLGTGRVSVSGSNFSVASGADSQISDLSDAISELSKMIKSRGGSVTITFTTSTHN